MGEIITSPKGVKHVLNQGNSIYSGLYFIDYVGEGLSFIFETHLGCSMTFQLTS